MKPTQEEILNLFDYNDLGWLTWKKDHKFVKTKGKKAGTKNNKYVKISIDGKTYSAHHLIWLYHYGCWPDCDIDHINRITTDNRIENLRLCPNNDFDNHQNKSISKRNKSGHTGICWDKSRSKWIVNIGVDNKLLYLGRFNDLNEAINVRNQAKIKYHTFV